MSFPSSLGGSGGFLGLPGLESGSDGFSCPGLMGALRSAAETPVGTVEPYSSRLEAVNAREAELSRLADRDLACRALTLRELASNSTVTRSAGEEAAELETEAFALVREAARRVLGLRPFDVQILGGLVLADGRVAEMPTGEGKTLAAVAPAFLNALSGRGVHVLTFNDYLARRDASWMGPVFEFLGMSVGCVQEGIATTERRQAYSRDVTYLTAKEAGFDLLRDGLCLELGEQVHRPFHFALVDEADSILIDEARIPLVIAGEAPDEPPALGHLAALARALAPGHDFATDEYAHNIFLTETGTQRVEAALACGNLFDAGNVNLLAAMRNALHAEHLLARDVDYLVRGAADGPGIELLDELTGRVAENRQWPDGLQAAVEAKEGLGPGSDGTILGSITLQHFLGLYPRLCGMTATAATSVEELAAFYGLEVTVVPPNRPCARVDEPDRIYMHRAARDAAVVAEVERAHRSGRPVLVGTASVAASERLAHELLREGIPCRVLNAKNDEQEAAIVAEAGGLGAVTISTNMAGRGTDIRLGGDEADRERVVGLGGLYVIGTHRHESRRIDRQLMGRAGRQGDPGTSRFFVTLDDELLKRYGIADLIAPDDLPSDAADRDEPVESAAVRAEVERAQRIIEGECYEVRKRLYSYSEILEKQRRFVRDWRQAILEEEASGILEERSAERWRLLSAEVGVETLRDVERRLTLLVIDRCWSEYLREMRAIRDEMHLVALDGREPLAEFYKTAIPALDRLSDRIDETVVEIFSRLEVTAEGVDWEAAGLMAPSATWTYLVSDNVFGGNLFRGLANRATLSVGGIVAYPLLFLWGLYTHWKRRRAKAS